MRKKTWKKMIWNLFLIIVIFIMIGCSKDNYQETVISPNDIIYEETDIVLKGIKGNVVKYSFNKEELYILTHEETDSHIYKVQPDGSNCTELLLTLSDNEMIEEFVVEENGGIIYLASKSDQENFNELVKVDLKGKEQIRENISKYLILSEESFLTKMVVDDKNNIILATAQTIYILDSALQLIDNVKIKNNYILTDFAKTKQGEIVCAQEKNGKDGLIEERFCVFDTERKKWSTELDGNFPYGGNCLINGLEHDFYYKDNFGIYGYRIEEETSTKILDARYSFLASDDLNGMVLAEKDRFFSVIDENTKTAEGLKLKIYSKINKEDLAGKKTITFATYNVSDRMRIIAKEFNKTNKDCRIELKIYEDEEHTRLLMDIISGNVPDIIDISALGISPEQCVEKGLLEELTTYYENNAEVIISSVSEGMKIEDKLYYVAPYFSIKSAVGRTSDIGNRTGWTFDEMKKMLVEKGEGVIPFDCEDKSIMLSNFLSNGLGDFVDWKSGECKFDSQEFKDILEICNGAKWNEEKELDEDIIFEQVENLDKRLMEGKVLLSVDSGVSLENIQLNRQRFGEDITYIGFPNKERKGSYFVFPQQYGICTKSDVKDEAWEFLCLVMSEEYQIDMKYLNYYMMPTNQDCFNWKVKAKMATQPYIDEFGNEIEPIEIQRRNNGATEIKTGPVSQKDVDIFVDLMNHTSKKVMFDEDLMDIITEEAQVYFKGEKSLDKTAEIIQKRISTYVNEQR